MIVCIKVLISPIRSESYQEKDNLYSASANTLHQNTISSDNFSDWLTTARHQPSSKWPKPKTEIMRKVRHEAHKTCQKQFRCKIRIWADWKFYNFLQPSLTIDMQILHRNQNCQLHSSLGWDFFIKDIFVVSSNLQMHWVQWTCW